MEYKFEAAAQNERPVLWVRRRTSAANLPQELGKAYKAIIEYLGEIGEKTEGPAVAAYYNMDMEDLDVGMGFLVPKALPGRGDIEAGVIPAGMQTSYMYKGPYADMAPVYQAMTEWMNENAHTPAGVCYEFYYNSPTDVPESELLTQIVFPLK